jgi:hypothetical protein
MDLGEVRTETTILAEKDRIFRAGNYVEVGSDHPDIILLGNFVAYLRDEEVDDSAREYFASLPFTHHELKKSSMCASLVIAFSLSIEGLPPIMAVNGMYNPQPYCHRLHEERRTGHEVGYDLCRTKLVCYQPEHSEVIVVRYLLEALGFINSDNYHEIIMEGSNDEQHPLGLIDIRKLKIFIANNPKIIEKIAELKDRIKLTMYGHKICCNNCKEVLTILGLADLPISVSQETYQYERQVRRLPLPELEITSRVEPELQLEL